MSWECDGCGKLFDSDEGPEVDEHFDKAEQHDTKCWGLMEVGQGAWLDFHEKGIHPMATFTHQFSMMLLEKHSELLPEILNPDKD